MINRGKEWLETQARALAAEFTARGAATTFSELRRGGNPARDPYHRIVFTIRGRTVSLELDDTDVTNCGDTASTRSSVLRMMRTALDREF